MQFPHFALLHSVTCSTQADNNSGKLRLRCGCQFLRCALILTVLFQAVSGVLSTYRVYQVVKIFLITDTKNATTNKTENKRNILH
jgi:hypothetical protein